MSEKATATDRRSFLKSGAIAAAPLAAVLPGAAMALDDSAARLARLEDERTIETLHRAAGRKADVRSLAEHLVALSPAPDAEATVVFSRDGRSATCRQGWDAEFETHLAGGSTVERMTRFQGHANARVRERRTLVADYRKSETGWEIAGLHLA